MGHTLHSVDDGTSVKKPLAHGWHWIRASGEKKPLSQAVKLKVMLLEARWYCWALLVTPTLRLRALALAGRTHSRAVSLKKVVLPRTAWVSSPTRHTLEDAKPDPISVKVPPLEAIAVGAIAEMVGTG